MIDASKTLKDYNATLLGMLEKLKDSPETFENIVTIEVDCDQLAPFGLGAESSPESAKVFRNLHNNSLNGSPAVYWFEITSAHTASQIRQGFEYLKTSIGNRKIPAANKSYDLNSRVLYVGKGISNISGRMFLHFGYEPKYVHLQGLQLCHWDYAGELKGLNLRLNIIYLPNEMSMLAPLFENKLAEVLRPILGRHR